MSLQNCLDDTVKSISILSYPEWPCVSAIVNTFERPELLERALESVLRQSFGDFEVLVIHDGPPDQATLGVCEVFATLFEARNIAYRFVALEENSGYQCVPKNVATWHARGDYIAYLDDDNEWTDDHLEILVDAIEEGDTWPDFVYGRREYVYDKGFVPPKGHKLPKGPTKFVPWTDEAKQRLATSPSNNFIDTSDMLIAKGALWRLDMATESMWNESLRRFADWELITRGTFFSGWQGKGVDAVVQRYHWHGKNIQLTRPINETPRQEKR